MQQHHPIAGIDESQGGSRTMTRIFKTLVHFVIDASGSMASIAPGVLSGLREYLQTQAAFTTTEAFVTLTTFNSSRGTRTHFAGMPINSIDLRTFEYVPEGLTPLLDAVGDGIVSVEARRHDFDQVIFVVVTDGQENASSRFHLNQVRKLVEERPTWTFVFLGANIDAWGEAASIGIGRRNAVQFTPTLEGVNTLYNDLSRATTAIRLSGLAHQAFSYTHAVEGKAVKAEDAAKADALSAPLVEPGGTTH